jgi:hypothetical protein
MLTISKDQIESLNRATSERFVFRTLRHIETHFSTHWRIIGEAQLRVVIRLAVERAGRHRLTTERDVCLYLNLMLLLGSAFDADMQLPWATKILSDAAVPNPQGRLERVYDAALEYLDRVAGKRDEHWDRALKRVSTHVNDKTGMPSAANFDDDAISLLESIYPHKFAAAGEKVISTFIAAAAQAAREHGAASRDHVMIYVSLAYMLGSGFDRDPQFPWADEILRNPTVPDPVIRFERLRTEGLSMLNRWASSATGS